jgi:acyl carrier protein
MEAEVVARVQKCVAKVLARPLAQITPEAGLMTDLGAESLDLVELLYLLEEEFSITLDQQDLSLSAQLGLPEAELHQHEVLTPKALELLRLRYPHAQALLKEGATRRQLAALLTVAEVARAVMTKLPPT